MQTLFLFLLIIALDYSGLRRIVSKRIELHRTALKCIGPHNDCIGMHRSSYDWIGLHSNAIWCIYDRDNAVPSRDAVSLQFITYNLVSYWPLALVYLLCLWFNFSTDILDQPSAWPPVTHAASTGSDVIRWQMSLYKSRLVHFCAGTHYFWVINIKT